MGAIALGCTLPAAIGTVGATPLRPAKTLDCSVGIGYCISWAMGVCGQGGNPDGVSYCCCVGACTCATILGAAIGALTLPYELISSSSAIFIVGCPLICHYDPQGIVTQQYLLHCFTPSLCPMLCKTSRSLKYYNKFASHVRSLVPYITSHGSYLAPSSVFVLSLASVTIALCVCRRTIASCVLVACPMFLESSSHIAHTMLSSSLERCRKLRNQLLCTPGVSAEACRFSSS